jgi:hypothetical protein
MIQWHTQREYNIKASFSSLHFSSFLFCNCIPSSYKNGKTFGIHRSAKLNLKCRGREAHNQTQRRERDYGFGLIMLC